MDLKRFTERVYELDGGHKAFDFGAFEIHSAFQPIYAINNNAGALYGVEALARPVHDTGMIEPLAFFRQLGPRDRFIADWACLTVHLSNTAAWQLGNTSLFVNLNPHSCTYRDDMLSGLEQYAGLVRAHGLKPNKVVFEITEESDGNLEDLSVVTRRIKELGFNVAIDDFGTGHSDLIRVVELKPDIVKIDAAWFRGMMEDEGRQQFAHSILNKLHEVGAHLLFESVETPRELHWARECAGSLIQGWLFGKATHMGAATRSRNVDVPGAAPAARKRA